MSPPPPSTHTPIGEHRVGDQEPARISRRDRRGGHLGARHRQANRVRALTWVGTCSVAAPGVWTCSAAALSSPRATFPQDRLLAEGTPGWTYHLMLPSEAWSPSCPHFFLPHRRKVFLQKSSVNLLSSVLDTPEFFWHAPDIFLTLYKRYRLWDDRVAFCEPAGNKST